MKLTAEDLGQLVVCIGTRDDAGIAGVRKARTGVVCKLSNDLAFAATDDHVGDGWREVFPARNGEQMVLALGLGNLDEGACCKTV